MKNPGSACLENIMMKVFVCSHTQKRISAHSRMHGIRLACFSLLAASLLTLSGCSSGSSSSKPQVLPIAFTDSKGIAKPTLTSLTVSQGTYLSVTLTDDPKLLGADWSVDCSSALAPGAPLPSGWTQDESCGTFTPGHTTSGPIPSYLTSAAGYVTHYVAPAAPPKEGTVTLYASATSDHSRQSSVTLTIGGLPISVGFAPAPPATLHPGTSAQFRAVLNNDVTNAGVKWSILCSSSDCGSLDPAQTTSGEATSYTAPAAVPTGGTVQVTATSVADPTKVATATIQIVP